MNAPAQHLLDRFDELSQEDKHEVAREILRRTSGYDSLPLSDDDLIANADELFQSLDEAEASHGKSA